MGLRRKTGGHSFTEFIDKGDADGFKIHDDSNNSTQICEATYRIYTEAITPSYPFSLCAY